MEFLENVRVFSFKQKLVCSHQSYAKEWGFCAFNKKSKCFVVEGNPGLHKRELLKNH